MSRAFVQSLFLVMFLGSVFFLPGVASAQSNTQAPLLSLDPNVSAPVYDITKEIKVQGTVYEIESPASTSGIGLRIQVQSSDGTVEVHLGGSPSLTPDAYGLTLGQKVTVMGMMAKVGGSSMLLARILTTPTRIFILRNEHGIPIRTSMPRGTGASEKPLKGGL